MTHSSAIYDAIKGVNFEVRLINFLSNFKTKLLNGEPTHAAIICSLIFGLLVLMCFYIFKANNRNKLNVFRCFFPKGKGVTKTNTRKKKDKKKNKNNDDNENHSNQLSQQQGKKKSNKGGNEQQRPQKEQPQKHQKDVLKQQKPQSGWKLKYNRNPHVEPDHNFATSSSLSHILLSPKEDELVNGKWNTVVNKRQMKNQSKDL